MKNFDMDRLENINPELVKMIKNAMSDPELIKGIAEGLMGDSDDSMNVQVDGVMTEIKDAISKVNNVIETSSAYDDLRDEITLFIENIVVEACSLITTLCMSWYESSEELDSIKASAEYRKYQSYLVAGFNEQQAFSLMMNKDKTVDLTAFNSFISKINTEINKQKQN